MDQALADLRSYLTLLEQIKPPDPETTPTLEILSRVQSAAWLLERIERAAVRKARIEGSSWSEIGNALHVTRQAAQQKHG